MLDLVEHYLAFGGYDDALALLERKYPDVPESSRENGAVPPSQSPLVSYYRGYVRQRLGREPGADFAAAGTMPAAYVFPNRASSYDVLRSAVKANPEDATAGFLLGSLYLSSGLTQAPSRYGNVCDGSNRRCPRCTGTSGRCCSSGLPITRRRAPFSKRASRMIPRTSRCTRRWTAFSARSRRRLPTA